MEYGLLKDFGEVYARFRPWWLLGAGHWDLFYLLSTYLSLSISIPFQHIIDQKHSIYECIWKNSSSLDSFVRGYAHTAISSCTATAWSSRFSSLLNNFMVLSWFDTRPSFTSLSSDLHFSLGSNHCFSVDKYAAEVLLFVSSWPLGLRRCCSFRMLRLIVRPFIQFPTKLWTNAAWQLPFAFWASRRWKGNKLWCLRKVSRERETDQHPR